MIKKDMNLKDYSPEEKEKNQKVLQRVKDKFKEYWRYLFFLVFVYITAYLLWSKILSLWVSSVLIKNNWSKNNLSLIILLGTIQGLLFSLDGFVTSLLKSPFQQMCYAINMAKIISEEDKDYIISRATESNEHCKENFKRFGILTITTELLKIFIKRRNLSESLKEENGPYADWLNLSYLIPLMFAAFAIFLIRQRLIKVEKKISKITQDENQKA